MGIRVVPAVGRHARADLVLTGSFDKPNAFSISLNLGCSHGPTAVSELAELESPSLLTHSVPVLNSAIAKVKLLNRSVLQNPRKQPPLSNERRVYIVERKRNLTGRMDRRGSETIAMDCGEGGHE